MASSGQPTMPSKFQLLYGSPTAKSGVVIFLGHNASNKLDLYYVAFEANSSSVEQPFPTTPTTESASHLPPPVEWKRLVSFPSAASTEKKMSKEEELLRERMRTRSSGVSTFVFHPPSSSKGSSGGSDDDGSGSSSGKLVIPHKGDLFWCTLPPVDTIATLTEPIELKYVIPPDSDASSAPSAAKMDPKWSPDGRFISYVCQNDVWLADPRTGETRQVTNAASRGCMGGVADYIMQEEFDRYTGYWWAPSGNPKAGYRILYFEVDESRVPSVSVPSANGIDGPEVFKFPKPGEPNAITNVKVAELVVDSGRAFGLQDTDMSAFRVIDRKVVDERLPGWVEYVARGAWGDSPNTAFVQVVDRSQEQWALVAIDVEAHTTVVAIDDGTKDKNNNMGLNQDNKMDEEPTTTEAAGDDDSPAFAQLRTSVWINVTNIFHALADGSGGIVYSSESNGFRNLVVQYGPNSSPIPITNAEGWVVLDSGIWVDEVRGLVYFFANRGNALEKHLFVAPLPRLGANPSAPAEAATQLSENGFCYTGTVCVRSSRVLLTRDSVECLPASAVFNVSHNGGNNNSGGRVLVPQCHVPHRAVPVPIFAVRPPKLVNFQTKDEETLYGAVYLPADFDPSKKYPMLLYTYGGPHVQLVSNSYPRMTGNLRLQLLTSLGFVCGVCDSRGSWNRGLAFEGHLKHRMGQVEIPDQVEFVDFVQDNFSVDPSRVFVTGWSYGGYMSLLAITQRPDRFKLVISGAPVVLWELYDNGYTERYMNTPANNPDGYKKGSPIYHLEQQQEHDLDDRIAIIHGLMDENVHFTHTAEFLNTLVKKGISHKLTVLPRERHGPRARESVKFVEHTIFKLLLKNI